MENVCPQCGAGLAAGATVCSFCGTRVEPPAAAVTYAERPGLNGMAVASFALSLLWIVGLASAVAIYTGYRARNQIKQTGERGSGLATAGLVIGTFGLITGILIVSLGTIFGGQETAHDTARARADILTVAAAESRYYDVHHSYPASTADLGVGSATLGLNEVINVASGPSAFCVVGTYGDDEPWFLYDSSNDGATLSTEKFDTGLAAENACVAGNVGGFATLAAQ
ncbi:MAG TPA: DUF4190 domain-containing protein [Mycobacteriales bacterium]|nr:DUF4190 domain-containing protein [Mycobacteriales bacterium]